MNREGSSFYTPLPSKATATEREISKVSSDPKFAQTFVASLLSAPGNAPSSSSSSAAVFESKVQAKTLLMDNAPIDPDVKTARKAKRVMQRKRNRTKVLSVKEKKALGLHRIPEEAIKYDMYIPLHALWTEYVTDLLGNTSPDSAVLNKLIRADFHGALLTVAQSKCPTLVGHSGIVIKDTEHMFFLVTKENQLKKVPKCNCVFTMPVGTERVFTLYGNQLRTRPADRATKKYKNRLTVELP